LLPDASGNFSLLTINLEIPEIQFSMKRNQEEKLFTMFLTKFVLLGELKNREQNIKLRINDMSLMQYQLPESKYQMIMTTVEQKNEDFGDEKTKEINACDIDVRKQLTQDETAHKKIFKIMKLLSKNKNYNSII